MSQIQYYQQLGWQEEYEDPPEDEEELDQIERLYEYISEIE